jgi:hypothetical protein
MAKKARAEAPAEHPPTVAERSRSTDPLLPGYYLRHLAAAQPATERSVVDAAAAAAAKAPLFLRGRIWA